MELLVEIEEYGKIIPVGHIFGNNASNMQFEYFHEYISSGHKGISISLSVEKKVFSFDETRNYFDGLLPEGFTRKNVASMIGVDEKDYIGILSTLGKECLGAIRITDAQHTDHGKPSYEKLEINQIENIAAEGAGAATDFIVKSHLSLTGASGKVGLYLDAKNNDWYLPRGSAPSTHIVKQSHVRLQGIVTNEQLALRTAQKLGIDVAESFIINTGDNKDSEILLATKRFDRTINDKSKIINKMPAPFRLHQEDFAQALGISSMEKYENYNGNYLNQMFDVLKKYSSNPIEDKLKLWDVIVFNYLIGNTDGHIKNFSLLYSEDMNSVRLAPAYDLISTIVYESNTHNMAFSIGNETLIDKISREHFKKSAYDAGISEQMALERFDMLSERFVDALTESAKEIAEMGFENAVDLQRRILDMNALYLH